MNKDDKQKKQPNQGYNTPDYGSTGMEENNDTSGNLGGAAGEPKTPGSTGMGNQEDTGSNISGGSGSGRSGSAM